MQCICRFSRNRNKYFSPICHLEEEKGGGQGYVTASTSNSPSSNNNNGSNYYYQSKKMMSTLATAVPQTTAGGSSIGFAPIGGNQYFSLRWNNYQNNLTSVFHELLENQSFVDVTLACEENSLKAHKVSILI